MPPQATSGHISSGVRRLKCLLERRRPPELGRRSEFPPSGTSAGAWAIASAAAPLPAGAMPAIAIENRLRREPKAAACRAIGRRAKGEGRRAIFTGCIAGVQFQAVHSPGPAAGPPLAASREARNRGRSRWHFALQKRKPEDTSKISALHEPTAGCVREGKASAAATWDEASMSAHAPFRDIGMTATRPVRPRNRPRCEPAGCRTRPRAQGASATALIGGQHRGVTPGFAAHPASEPDRTRNRPQRDRNATDPGERAERRRAAARPAR